MVGNTVVAGGEGIWMIDINTNKETKIDSAHVLINCVRIYDKKILSCAPDKTIQILDTFSGKSEIIHGHDAEVMCMDISDTTLVTGSADNSIKIWKINTGELTATLLGHTKKVWNVKIHQNNCIISASEDTTIKIWDLNTGTCTRTLTGHVSDVCAICVKDNALVSASWDWSIKIWNLSEGRCCFTLDGHQDNVVSVGVRDDMVVSMSNDGTIKIWKGIN